MPLDTADLLACRQRGYLREWQDTDCLLYALACGLGRDPLNASELPYVFEGNGLSVLPSFASVLAESRLLDGCGWDLERVLHGEERLILHRPLTEAGAVQLDSRVAGVRDLGAGRGAYIELETIARGTHDPAPLFTVVRTIVARGDGGFGGPTARLRAAHVLPTRPPDLFSTLKTRRDQALLYRLCGDRNPLHADPALARRLGQPAPLLHGLCTWGIACRAILQTICEYDPTLIRSLAARFSAPVYPGETLVTEMWQDAQVVSFRVRAEERDVIVVSHGRCELAI